MHSPLIDVARDPERAAPQTSRQRTQSDDITFNSVIARLYLNPCLLDQERASRVPKSSELPPKVKAIRDIISENLAHGINQGGETILESFIGGQLSLCGSIAEGTKVGGADEFDFQYLLTLDGLDARPKRLLRTKPRSTDQASLSFFSLRVPCSDGVSEEMLASTIQDRFLLRIKLLLQPLIDDIEVKKAGPAVKISFKDDKGHVIKVDLTLGLCGRGGGNDSIADHLSPLARSLDAEGRLKSHYVAANDYWKICFVDTMQDLLSEIIKADEIKGAVYRVIKLLRDEADIKDPYGDGILPSYPIKVTFLDVAYQDHAKGITWAIQDVTFHVIKILREVERRGLSHSLCCLFLEDDDVMAEGDRSYLESRRLLLELKGKEKFYASLRYKLFCFMTTCLVFSCCTSMVGILLHVVGRYTTDEPRVQKGIVNGLIPIIFAFFCLDNLRLWVFKPERLFKLYPFWPISCILLMIFQQTPLFAVLVLDHFSMIASYMWQVYNGGLCILVSIMLFICIANSVRGLYSRKSFFILDISALYLNIIRPYNWKSPSSKNIPYLPEIGIFTPWIKLTYILAILLCSMTLFATTSLAVISIGIDMEWIPGWGPIRNIIFATRTRGIIVTLIPFEIMVIIVLLSIISNVYQRRALKDYVERLF